LWNGCSGKGKRMKRSDEETFLLDTSALMAYLEDEDGAGEVESILRGEKCYIPFLALLEIYYITFREKGEEVALNRYAMLKNLDVEYLHEVDEATLLLAGKFKGAHHLSLADAIIAAFAVRRDAVLVHKDPEYEQLKGFVRMRCLPYKK